MCHWSSAFLHAVVKLIVLVVSNDTYMSSVICSLFGAIHVSIIPNLVPSFINTCSFSITLPRSLFGCNGLLSTLLIFTLTKLLTWNEIVLGCLFSFCHCFSFLCFFLFPVEVSLSPLLT